MGTQGAGAGHLWPENEAPDRAEDNKSRRKQKTPTGFAFVQWSQLNINFIRILKIYRGLAYVAVLPLKNKTLE